MMMALVVITLSVAVLMAGVPSTTAACGGATEEWIAQEWWKAAQERAQFLAEGHLDENAIASAFREYDTYGSVSFLWSVYILEKSDSNDVVAASLFFQKMIRSTKLCDIPNLNTFLDQFVNQNPGVFDHDYSNSVEFPEFESFLFFLASIEAELAISAYDEDGTKHLEPLERENVFKDLSLKIGNRVDIQNDILKAHPVLSAKMDDGAISSVDLAMFHILIWDKIAESNLRVSSYQLLKNKHCVPSSSFPRNTYKDTYSAMMDCDKNRKCAMINNPGCIEDGNGFFQLCTGLFRDLRGKKRRQPLPSPKGCVHVK